LQMTFEAVVSLSSGKALHSFKSSCGSLGNDVGSSS
jgi:hypothetical protein